MAEEQVQQQFAMQRIYTKDISFESPATPGVFKKQWQPAVNVDLNTKSDKIDDNGNFEVVLSITITAKVEEETAFLVEVQQAGIFMITGIEGEDLRRVLGTAAPNILFPYARESIDSLCVKGGFPPVMLAPVNFDALYQQALAQSQAQAAQADDGEAATH
ncbi:protein-export chaperone SecB [Pseudohalioglobus lutimaris]|uniref:Protein-export protein SecB n=1 Tax=Pseudohalioglobus lutimaris TaxID=1737061 RepID=A0A2N5WWM5_9GAMM|nr:protein-export chaperone SecB [Pseudohalioglobus lutimaris]PLW66630.1 protein-export chaperone SecB [Pseudohalioglobus lutimaris]